MIHNEQIVSVVESSKHPKLTTDVIQFETVKVLGIAKSQDFKT